MKIDILKITALAFVISSATLFAQENTKANFGTQEDVEYSKYLWEKLEATKLNSTKAIVYVAGPSHDRIREVLESKIDGNRVIVARNYDGDDIRMSKVRKDRAKYLQSIDVMIKKEGYNPKYANWYWAKFKADGTLHETDQKVKIAGKVSSCIACHINSSDGSFVFEHNMSANSEITMVKALEESSTK
ncbi:MAG: cytochrome P460 family protein [Poseidonibacter sp.]|uniref:cytochrome P460 family protein n=1 Tax=Poseidonibacter sp. TaxID=2321188 RepID=UPI00359D0F9A